MTRPEWLRSPELRESVVSGVLHRIDIELSMADLKAIVELALDLAFVRAPLEKDEDRS